MYKDTINLEAVTGGFFPYGFLHQLHNYDFQCLIEESETTSSGNGKVGDGVGGGGAGGW